MDARAAWKMPRAQLKSYGVNPAWLDLIFPHRGGTWRVEGLRSIKPCTLVIVSIDNGAVATIRTSTFKKILKKFHSSLDEDYD